MTQAATKSASAQTLYAQLSQPFELKYLKYRVGATNKAKTKGIALFYLDAREVTRRLNEVVGMDGWATKETAVTSGGQLMGVKCELSLKMPYKNDRGVDTWNTKTDFGEPSKTAPLKGAASDALKRAAVLFGVGRYLYYIPNHWFDIDENRQFKDDPKVWLAENCRWAIQSKENLEKWEDVATLEYDPANDVDLDQLEFEGDDVAQRILQEARSKRDELVQHLKDRQES